MAHSSDQETDDPYYANDRNFYKLKKWTKDGSKVDSLLYAGNSRPSRLCVASDQLVVFHLIEIAHYILPCRTYAASTSASGFEEYPTMKPQFTPTDIVTHWPHLGMACK